MIVALAVATIWFWRKRSKTEVPIDMVELLPSGNAAAEWWVRWDQILLKHRLGKGTFGTVYFAVWRGTDVALKMLHDAGMLRPGRFLN